MVSIGRRAAFAEATLKDTAGRLYASATSTFLVMRPVTATSSNAARWSAGEAAAFCELPVRACARLLAVAAAAIAVAVGGAVWIAHAQGERIHRRGLSAGRQRRGGAARPRPRRRGAGRPRPAGEEGRSAGAASTPEEFDARVAAAEGRRRQTATAGRCAAKAAFDHPRPPTRAWRRPTSAPAETTIRSADAQSGLGRRRPGALR